MTRNAWSPELLYWRAGDVLPGRYQLRVRAVQLTRIVNVVEADSGSPLARVTLFWHTLAEAGDLGYPTAVSKLFRVESRVAPQATSGDRLEMPVTRPGAHRVTVSGLEEFEAIQARRIEIPAAGNIDVVFELRRS